MHKMSLNTHKNIRPKIETDLKNIEEMGNNTSYGSRNQNRPARENGSDVSKMAVIDI
jgi:hypothetical protein